MRYVHIVSAVVAMGGLTFMLLCLSPTTRVLDDGFSDSWMKMIRRRFDRVVWLSIAGLVVSGVYNWVLSAGAYKAMGPVGNILIGTKVLLAMAMFAVVWMGGSGMLKPRAAQMINVHLGAVVVLLAVILRYLRLEYLQGLAGG